jgi:pyruvate/2-oxoglutarate dehydrogenase complex dihydrolipoamide dehydrogenase (E3) component
MKNTDILIIGGSAAGFVAATTTKMNNPEKEVLLIRKEEKVMVPCGIPYIFGTIGTSDKNVLSDAGLEKTGVNLKIDEVININCKLKQCKTKDGDTINFEKLIIATGSIPVKPKWLKGNDLQNVFTIPKNKEYLDKFQTKINELNNIIVVGAGFIGVETADELRKSGKNVTLIEKLPNILSLAFDKELAVEAESILKERGINLITGIGILEIKGNEKVSEIILENGKEVIADAVILSMGYAPNTELAKECGLQINEKGFIKTDEYMRTGVPDVFAVGDCAEKKDFFTRKPNTTMLASIACTEARTAAMNLYKLSTLKTISGTIAIYSTAIGNTSFSTAGLTENQAIEEGFDIVTGIFQGMDKHPGSLPNTHKQVIKLIASKDNGTLLGGEIIGGISSGELINVIGFAIQNKMTLGSILTSQIGTHPLLTGSPAGYPLIKAAEVAYQKI